MNQPHEPYLLTPGPLTTSMATKSAMLRDWDSWDSDFNELTAGAGGFEFLGTVNNSVITEDKPHYIRF